MANYRLTVQYDGTAFAGWQTQPRHRTVQGELERVVKELAGRPVPVTGAGRTDAGVHAVGQVASLQMDWRHGLVKLVGAINARLPVDVAVTAAAEAPEGFDARRSAIERLYRFTWRVGETRSPMLDRFTEPLGPRVSVALMRRAAACFRGRHDFAGFTTLAARQRATIRRVSRITLARRGDLVRLDVAADGFLHHMVRLIAGAVVAAGQGSLPVAVIRRALVRPPEEPRARMAAARGLALLAVRYPGDRRATIPDWPLGT